MFINYKKYISQIRAVALIKIFLVKTVTLSLQDRKIKNKINRASISVRFRM